MKTFALLPLLLLTFVGSVNGQVTLDGLWEGTMTVGGIYSDKALPMQLYLTTEDNKVTGRSYVTLPDGSILRMDLRGYVYGDLSISLIEVSFGGDPDNDVMPEFNRQYQIVYKPDIWNSELKGYWQEQMEATFYEKRRRGRMVLRKQKAKRA